MIAEFPLRVPITDSFDLHSFEPRDVASVLDEYLREASERGFQRVRVIHGKGTGARRAQVRRLLANNATVQDYFDAGGSGATIVILRKGT